MKPSEVCVVLELFKFDRRLLGAWAVDCDSIHLIGQAQVDGMGKLHHAVDRLWVEPMADFRWI
jgi:hypothetical protein